MFAKFAIPGSVLCLLSFARAFEVTPYVEDGIPQHLNITTGPFLKIGHGYYYIEARTQKNWFDAFASCRRLGANLVSFETIEEWDLINQYLWRNKINNIYWVSGTDLANQGKHEWLSTGQPISLKIWYPGEPNNHNGIEHCDLREIEQLQPTTTLSMIIIAQQSFCTYAKTRKLRQRHLLFGNIKTLYNK